MEDIQGKPESIELNSLSEPKTADRVIENLRYKEDSSTPIRKNLCGKSKRKIYLVVGISVFIAVALTIILAVVLTRKENSHVDDYQETQYVLKVKTTITSKLGSQKSSNHDEVDLTLFALDMKGDKYSLMIVNGIFSNDAKDSNLGDAPTDIFMSFDVSKSGEILETRYVKDKFTEENANLLTGIIQAFVVDQDSEFDVESECKKTKKGSTQCTKNSKHKDGKKSMYRKSGKHEEFGDDSDESLEHTSKTWIDHNGKVEKSMIQGLYSKVYKGADSEDQMDYEMKAEVVVISSEKLTAEQVKLLNEVDQKLPQVSEKTEYKTKKMLNEVHIEQNNEVQDDHPPSISTDSKLARQLNVTEEHGRSLFDYSFSYKYFSFFDTPFYLNSRMYTGYDSSYKFWTCGIHRFQFSTAEVKLLSTDFCISSNRVLAKPRYAITSWAQVLTVNAYVTKINFSIFTINLYSSISVNNMPYVETYYNVYGNSVTKMNIVASITVSVKGEATIGLSRGGLMLNSYMKSNINDYMVGYNAPFSAYMYLDKSIQGDFQVWVQYLTLGKTCYIFLGITICVPQINYSSAVTLAKMTYAYQYYPEVNLLYATF